MSYYDRYVELSYYDRYVELSYYDRYVELSYYDRYVELAYYERYVDLSYYDRYVDLSYYDRYGNATVTHRKREYPYLSHFVSTRSLTGFKLIIFFMSSMWPLSTNSSTPSF